MRSGDLEFTTNMLNKAWESAGETEAPLSKQIRPERSCPDKSYEYVTEELVINTLRSSQSPETIYWLLRYFVETNKAQPVIQTDRGKTVYIDYDRFEESISVYVGDSDEVNCVGEHDGSKIYAMQILEKYDFLWYSTLGVALKRQMHKDALIELATLENPEAEPASLTLFYTTGQAAACVVRSDWHIAGKAEELESSQMNTIFSSEEEHQQGSDKLVSFFWHQSAKNGKSKNIIAS